MITEQLGIYFKSKLLKSFEWLGQIGLCNHQ